MDTLVPRRFVPALRPNIPRHWLPGDPVVSSILNTYTVLVPANERFYIRTLKRCLPRVSDPTLRAAIAAFLHQEAQHGDAHRRYWRNLDGQGYRYRAFERIVDRYVFGAMERIAPLPLRASLVACVEHINAYLGHEFLAQRILERADPEMRALMEWHFAEEIEHKAVSFDALRAVSPSYALRALGFLLTAPLFYLLMSLGMFSLLAQDRLLRKRATWIALWRHLGRGHGMALRTLRHLADYLRPGFHPSQRDDRALAAAVIARYEARTPPWLAPTARSEHIAQQLSIPAEA